MLPCRQLPPPTGRCLHHACLPFTKKLNNSPIAFARRAAAAPCRGTTADAHPCPSPTSLRQRCSRAHLPTGRDPAPEPHTSGAARGTASQGCSLHPVTPTEWGHKRSLGPAAQTCWMASALHQGPLRLQGHSIQESP